MLKAVGAIDVECFAFQDSDRDGRHQLKYFVGRSLPGGYTIRKLQLPTLGVKSFPFEFIVSAARAHIPVVVFIDDYSTTPLGWMTARVVRDPNGNTELQLVSKPPEFGNGEGQITIYQYISPAYVPMLRNRILSAWILWPEKNANNPTNLDSLNPLTPPHGKSRRAPQS